VTSVTTIKMSEKHTLLLPLDMSFEVDSSTVIYVRNPTLKKTELRSMCVCSRNEITMNGRIQVSWKRIMSIKKLMRKQVSKLIAIRRKHS
jgi:hypothetical protein